MIIYTGEDRYTVSTDFFDLFGTRKELAKQYLLTPIKLVDVCRMSDEEIKKHQLFGITEFTFKHKKTKNFQKFLTELFDLLKKQRFRIDTEYAKLLIKYMMHVFPSADHKLLAAEIEHFSNPTMGDVEMTIAQQLREEGRQQGVQQGLHVVAKKLLKYGLDPRIICKGTDLPLEELLRLKKELESAELIGTDDKQ